MRLRGLTKLLPVLFLLLSVGVGIYLVRSEAFFFGRASGEPANLIIDTGSSFSVPPESWRNLAQGGEEPGRMLLPVVDKLKGLSPEYIRIDHVYDFYDVVKRDGGGKITYDWSKLDLTLGDILSTGAKPFISLSYTPKTLTDGEITDLPRDWGEWERLVAATVEHISGGGGLGIANVYYEVWNEPDLFGKFKVRGQKNYLTLYLHTVRGATRAQNVSNFKIGGPATTALYENWFKSLLNFVQENSLRLDFFSWHRYSKEMDVYEKDVLNVKKWLADYPAYGDIELIISEMGPNSENDKVYDSDFGAIHVLAAETVMDGELDRIFAFEIKDGPGSEKFWGRWGILTHEKFGAPEPKPRYLALEFLNRMLGNKVNIAGEGSWVKATARERGSVVRTLVVNYDPSGSHTEAVPLTFLNLRSPNFTFRRINFGGGVEELQVATTSSSWSTLERFSANSAAIIEIIPR